MIVRRVPRSIWNVWKEKRWNSLRFVDSTDRSSTFLLKIWISTLLTEVEECQQVDDVEHEFDEIDDVHHEN